MTPFAEMNTAMNAAIVEFLADAQADFGAGVTVVGLFRSPPAEAFGLIGGNRPTFEALSSDLSGVSVGSAIALNGASYMVAEMSENAGLTTLSLELA